MDRIVLQMIKALAILALISTPALAHECWEPGADCAASINPTQEDVLADIVHRLAEMQRDVNAATASEPMVYTRPTVCGVKHGTMVCRPSETGKSYVEEDLK